MKVVGPVQPARGTPIQRVCDECLEPKAQLIELSLVVVTMPSDELDRPCYCLDCLLEAVAFLKRTPTPQPSPTTTPDAPPSQPQGETP